MKDDHYSLIKNEYQNSGRDSTGLFQAVLSISAEIGLDEALKILEKCVFEKRSSWMDRNEKDFERSGNAVLDGYRLFYERYLGLSLPRDGETIQWTDQKIVVRWCNFCPTLEACQKLGLDTRQVCRVAYHRPVQNMLSRLDSRLRFRRDYDTLRPYGAFCEETIELEEGEE